MTISDFTTRPHRLLCLLVVATFLVGCASERSRLPGDSSPTADLVSPEKLRFLTVIPPTPEHYLAYVGTQGSYHHFVLQDGEGSRRYIVSSTQLSLVDTFSLDKSDRRYVILDDHGIHLVHPDDLF